MGVVRLGASYSSCSWSMLRASYSSCSEHLTPAVEVLVLQTSQLSSRLVLTFLSHHLMEVLQSHKLQHLRNTYVKPKLFLRQNTPIFRIERLRLLHKIIHTKRSIFCAAFTFVTFQYHNARLSQVFAIGATLQQHTHWSLQHVLVLLDFPGKNIPKTTAFSVVNVSNLCHIPTIVSFILT